MGNSVLWSNQLSVMTKTTVANPLSFGARFFLLIVLDSQPFDVFSMQVEHVLATQTLLQKPAKNMKIQVDGELPVGSSKTAIPTLPFYTH